MEDKNQTNTTPTTSEGNATPAVTPEATVVDAVVEVSSDVVTTAASDAPVAETVVTAPVAPAAVVVPPAAVTEVPAAVEIMPTDGATAAINASAAKELRAVMIKQYAIAFAVVLVMAGGVTYVLEQQGRIQTHLFDKITAMVNPAPAAVIVNGVTVSLADYEKNKKQLEQAATQGGEDLTNVTVQEQIKTQALDVLINTELLRQEATKAGIVVTDEQVQARYAEIVKGLQGEDKLQARMAELGITKEGLMKDIAAEILIQTHLSKAIDTSSIVIDAKDIKAAYDQANANPDSPLPPLEQVSSAIESELKRSKEQDMIAAYLQKVRDGASIDKKI